jgi:hypothetical protein
MGVSPPPHVCVFPGHVAQVPSGLQPEFVGQHVAPQATGNVEGHVHCCKLSLHPPVRQQVLPQDSA